MKNGLVSQMKFSPIILGAVIGEGSSVSSEVEKFDERCDVKNFSLLGGLKTAKALLGVSLFTS
jgi:hypothetical protein